MANKVLDPVRRPPRRVPLAERIGVAWFDDPERPGAGWACVQGTEPRRIDGPQALALDYTWATNWVGQPGPPPYGSHVRDEHFLGVALGALADQWGLGASRQDVAPSDRVAVLAELARRLVNLVTRHYGEPVTGDGRLRMPASLFDWVRDALRHKSPPTPMGSIEADQALRGAYLLEHISPIDPDYRTQAVEFLFPRARYAQMLLGLRGPAAGSTFEPYRGLVPRGYSEPGPTGEIYRFLSGLASRQPALVELHFKTTDRTVGALMGPVSRHRLRTWFAAEEAAQLAAYGQVAVRRVFVAEQYSPLGAGALALPREGQAGEVAPSYGVLSELHWRALADPNIGTGEAVAHSTGPMPARAVWVATWDRLLCLQAALAFHAKGLQVSRYGQGRVSVQVPFDGPETAAAVMDRFCLQVARL